MNLGLSLRETVALIEVQLPNSVPPNAGPGVRRGRRVRGKENSGKRNENMYKKKVGESKEKKWVAASTSKRVNECAIGTCNVEGMSGRENNRPRMRRVADRIGRDG